MCQLKSGVDALKTLSGRISTGGARASERVPVNLSLGQRRVIGSSTLRSSLA